MMHATRLKNFRHMLAPCLLAILLAFAGLAVADAQGPPTGPPDNGMNGAPTPTATPGNGGPTDPGGPGTDPDAPGDPSGPTGDPDKGDMGGGGMASAPSTSNRIVFHAATPAQLVKTGDGGLHYYFIGADGSIVTGPVLSSFAKLAEMHPSGAPVSLFSGANPSTGKSVDIYYLPDEKKIKVNTFYPGGHDEYNPHKAYDFTVDADYAVKHVNW